MYRSMTGKQFLDYMTALQPLKHKDYPQHLIDIFQAQIDQPLQSLSKGNRQKIGLIQAFMHEPEVLILDEPTSGLDPLMQEAFFNLVKEVKARGGCVFVSSHNLTEVRRMCDRVGFIRSGSLVAEQSISDLTSTAAQTFDISFGGPAPLEALQRLKGKVTVLAPNRVTIHVLGDLSPFLQLLAVSKVTQLDKPEVNLEEEFLQFYDQKTEDRD